MEVLTRKKRCISTNDVITSYYERKICDRKKYAVESHLCKKKGYI